MNVPYALHDFRELRRKNLLYVDKTKYIELLENMEYYVLFLRPRRFGKTLFTSLLYYYYDVNYEPEFESLFGNLYIGSHKTSSANSYHVLKLDFSGMETGRDRMEIQFAECLKISLESFIKFHNLDIAILSDSNKSNIILRDFLYNYQNLTDTKIFLLIDEYDHFANDILSDDKNYFLEITGKDGFIRKFYEVFKIFTGDIIDRIFITGVTPITLDSLTSGFKVSANIGKRELLNDMIGFTEDEVLTLLSESNIDHKYINIVRENYNGYMFSIDAKHKVYNSNLLLYFIKEYNFQKGIPKNLIDQNVISDHRRLAKLFNLYQDDDDKRTILMNILEGKSISFAQKDDDVLNFVKLDSSKQKSFFVSRNDFLSFLHYLGLLTINSQGDLTVPNKCIKDVYSNFYMQYLSDLSGIDLRLDHLILAVKKIAQDNDFSNFNLIVSDILNKLANIDYQRFDEKYVKLIVFSLLTLSSNYNVKSEYEFEGKRSDILLLPNYHLKANYYHMIEIKYLKKEDDTKEKLEQVRLKAKEQILHYYKKEEIASIPNLKLHILIVVKNEIRIFEDVT